ncbi:hypothetical protein [Actinomadura sp. 7K534]|nr:hypothetical protein [Actinomadura sp. 7K534]
MKVRLDVEEFGLYLTRSTFALSDPAAHELAGPLIADAAPCKRAHRPVL